MDPADYERFTRDLEERLSADPRVLGLVAVGSMAGQPDHPPDRWSDHDFFVVVAPADQESFRSNLDWLPSHGEIALSFRETAHGVKVVFRDGHLVEFAVFDPDELAVARVNRYRVHFDRERIGERLAHVAETTAAQASPPSDEWLVGQFLTSLLVGAGRHHRGERLAGRRLVEGSALAHLAVLLAKHTASPDAGELDSLDPLRRFEAVFPSLGRRLEAAAGLDTPAAAQALLAIALEELPGKIPAAAVAAIAPRLDPGTGPSSAAGTPRSPAERAKLARPRSAPRDRRRPGP